MWLQPPITAGDTELIGIAIPFIKTKMTKGPSAPTVLPKFSCSLVKWSIQFPGNAWQNDISTKKTSVFAQTNLKEGLSLAFFQSAQLCSSWWPRISPISFPTCPDKTICLSEQLIYKPEVAHGCLPCCPQAVPASVFSSFRWGHFTGCSSGLGWD